MTNQNCLTSACRYCRFYRPEGLHRGACEQLSVSVNSNWKACQLALPAFASSWENVEELTNNSWQNKKIQPLQIVNLSGAGIDLSSSSLAVNNLHSNNN